MLCAPPEDQDWWVHTFADLMHAMLSYELPLADGRVLWLEAWQFPTDRVWLGWRVPEATTGYVPALKQRLIAHGLGLPDPAWVIEERYLKDKPPELGGGTMVATKRLRQWTGIPLW
jgi:hypothetical protein